MTAPIIGLTTYGRNEIDLQTTHYSEWFAIPTFYVDAVRRAGGFPILLPPGETAWESVLDILDGVILIGGCDIHPDNYNGRSTHPALGKIDPERDASELALIETVMNKIQLPTLCICRGLQVANVAAGGTLHEDIPDVVEEDIHRGSDKGWTVQAVEARAGSLVAETMGTREIATYSGHHQAVKDLGQGLRATAAAADGIIEAVEKEDHPWLIGVQWHPEVTAQGDPSQQRLFDGLIDAARMNQQRKQSVHQQ